MDLFDLDINDLDLDLVVPPSRSGKPKSVVHSLERAINAGDLAILIDNPDRKSETPSILKLKQSHHALAQLLAEGRPDVEVSLITGYSQTRISILKNDPAFKELLAHYKGVTKEIYINVHERLKNISLDALEEMHSRLEEHPEGFTLRQLQDIAELGFDRSGFGPKSTQVSEIHLSTSDLLSSVKDEIRKKSHASIETLDLKSRRTQAPSDPGADLGLEIDFSPVEYSDITRERGQGGGAAVREAGGEEASSSGTNVVPIRPEARS